MHLNLLFPLFLFATSADGQIKKDGAVLTTTYPHQEAVEHLKLADLRTSPESLHFRFWTEAQVVDIWTEEMKTFNGTLANFTYVVPHFGRGDTVVKVKKSFYSAPIALDTAMARKVYDLFSKDSVFNVQTDYGTGKQISGLDGVNYSIEYATNNYYSIKGYWSPSAIKHERQAVILNTAIKKLEQLLDMRRSWNTFVFSLPPDLYHYEGMTGVNTKSWLSRLSRKRRV